MAFVDQDRSREKLLSGMASITLVGVIGYVLATGMAINVIRNVGQQVTLRDWKAEPPPPPPPLRKVDRNPPKTSHPVFIETPLVPPIAPVTPQIETGTTPFPPISGPALSVDPTPATLSAIVNRAVEARPRGNPANWVTTDDYPALALRNGEQGKTGFRLDVGTDGHPTACAITQSSGSSELDRAACRNLMRKANFNVARDATGAPVSSSYANAIVWRLPGD